MATSGGQPGNQNAKRAKEFESALRKALAREAGSVSDGLVVIADKLVVAAKAGEQWAVREIADRLDGKPGQSLVVGGDPENPLKIESKPPLDFDAIRAKRSKGL